MCLTKSVISSNATENCNTRRTVHGPTAYLDLKIEIITLFKCLLIYFTIKTYYPHSSSAEFENE
jgi:hypothetical protein